MKTRTTLVSGLLLVVVVTTASGELWQSGDLGAQMDLSPPSDEPPPYSKVELRCGADAMFVKVHTAQDFDGVLYTRGSFHARKEPCFLDAKGGRSFSMELPLSQCLTNNQEDQKYKNVLVLQHDDELVTPGDAAFTLECDFTVPRTVSVSADMNSDRAEVSSKISLADPDPGGKDLPRYRRSTVTSENGSVVFTPDDIRPRKKRKSNYYSPFDGNEPLQETGRNQNSFAV